MTDLPDPLIGRLLQDTWRLESFVARGSMGSVYRGVNQHCGTPVAVKILNPEFLNDPEIRERFRRESTVSSRCDSPHLVRVLDLVTEPDGLVALVMEWLHGETLAAHLKHEGRLSVAETVALIGEVGEGLHEAHEMGIIHRDLKPGNIFLAETGRAGLLVPKIVDFGISKIIEEGSELTATATMMGTPHYMPVEQFDNSKDVDTRADIYALGVITYELLAGHRPYRGKSPMAILNQVANAQPPALPEDVPSAVVSVVLRAMAKHAEDRYDTVRGYCEALAAAAEEAGPVPEARTDPPTALGLAATTGALPALPKPHRLRQWLGRQPRWRLFVAGGVVLLGVGLGLWLGLRPSAGADRTPASRRAPSRPRTLGRPGPALLPLDAAARGLAVDAAGTVAVAVDAHGGWRRYRLASGAAEEHVAAGASGGATAVALSPDGQFLALGQKRGEVVLRELRTHQERRLRTGAGSAMTAVAFSDDGNRLLSGDRAGRLQVWDVREAVPTTTLTRAGAAVTAVALRGDGRVAVAGRTDGSLGVWSTVTGRPVAHLAGHDQAVQEVALHPSGTRLASAGAEGTCKLWRLPSGRLERVLRGHRGAVTAVALSEDGRWVLTGGADGTARLYPVAGPLRARQVFPGPVHRVAFAAGGDLRLVAGPSFGVRVFRNGGE